MGFQQPPTLPDYAKLITSLNESTVQKWNPALYQILKNLIQAVQQSQDVIVNNAADVINNFSGGGLTSVAVDPAGAILGDGTPGGPLRVQVDGTTIQILADTLVASAGLTAFGVNFTQVWVNGSIGGGGLTISPNSTIGTISGVPNFVIAPIKIYCSAHQDDNGGVPNNGIATPTSSAELVFNTTGFPVIGTTSANIFFASVGNHNQTSLNEPVAALVAGALLNDYKGKDVIVRTTNTGNVTVTGNTIMNITTTVGVAYLLIPA